MIGRRRTIGARLATTTALVAMVAVALFAACAAVVIWRHEAAEVRGPGDEAAADEVVGELGLGLALSTPVVLVIAAVATRRAARRITTRIDDVIARATRMSGAAPTARLPLTGHDDELDRLAAALNALFDRVAAAAAAQQQFVADASHELRTPLTVLSTELEVARRHPREIAAWERLADRALAEVGRMNATVEALLRLARADAVAPSRADAALAALIDAAIDRAGRAAPVEVAPIGEAPPLHVDVEAVSVALANLIANAARHTAPGTAVAIAVEVGPRAVAIIVDDHGPGVAAADRTRIFQPFARGGTASDRARGDGVGLGLSVARRIAVSHGGDVTVSDAPGGGARFVLTLPRATAQADATAVR